MSWNIISLAIDDKTLAIPKWNDVECAIRSLNESQNCSCAVITAADDSQMFIGGGDGRYHVQITYPPNAEPEILTLSDEARGHQEEDLILDGIKTPLPARLVVHLEMVLQAAFVFYEQGPADGSLVWEY